MRWHVHGTDAGTGQDVVLALDEREATHAVQTAIAKRILVSHVTREAGEGLRRMVLPMACAAVVVLAPLCAAVYVQNLSFRARLDVAVSEQKRLAQAAAQAETLASQIRQGTPAGTPSRTAEETAAQMTALVEQLASARTRASQNEQQLNATFQQLGDMQRLANEVPLLQSRLKEEVAALHRSAGEVLRLGQENAAQRQRIEELATTLDPVVKKLEQTEAANKDLTAQVDTLKQQLLVAAATATAPAKPEVEPVPAVAMPRRWAMLTSFDAAAELLRVGFDKETFRNVTTADGAVASSGAKPANATAIKVLHDAAKERVYGATLTVSLAPDAPREKLAENQALVVEFLRVFAPSAERPGDLMGAALARVGQSRDPGLRWVDVGADYKLTVWHQGNGLYAFKAESPRGEFED